MTTRRFTKTYPSIAAAQTARAHYRWLSTLHSDVTFPELFDTTGRDLKFTHVDGRTAQPGDLTAIAAALGRLHSAARRAGLERARANSSFTTTSVHLEPFAEPRRQRLHEVRAHAPDCPLDHEDIDAWLGHAARLPTALYKDANPRNFLITRDADVVMIDFDSLTLAPIGYDLAKLLVTTSMTYGYLSSVVVKPVLEAYTDEVGTPLAFTDLAVWAEFHDLLTRSYLGRHGYRHPWPTVRPWPIPDVTVSNTGSR